VHGDFGRSMIDDSTVMSHILDRLPNTLELTGTAIIIGIIVSVPLGVIGALRRGSKIDHSLTVVSVAGFAVPQFWMGLMLILIFSVTLEQHGLPWLPSSGAFSAFAGGDILDRIQHLALPATVLSFFYMSTWSRFIRSSMLEVLSQDYIRTARPELLERIVGTSSGQPHRHRRRPSHRPVCADRDHGAALFFRPHPLPASDDQP